MKMHEESLKTGSEVRISSQGTERPVVTTVEPTEKHNAIVNLLAQKFIARSDIKAIQHPDGSYAPRHSKFTRDDLLAHIRGEATYGHYMIDLNNKTKLIVFDIDINKEAKLPREYDPENGYSDFVAAMARDVWRARGVAQDDERFTQRDYLRGQLRMMANKLMRGVWEHLQVPTTMAYTGSKGVHVYAFTGLVDADLARVGQQVVLDGLGCFQPKKGNNFYKHVQLTGFEDSFAELEVEVYPKQAELTETRQFGNLVRLPLGINRHNPSHPCFFMDARGNYGSRAIMRRDALDALTNDDPWAGPAPA